MLRGYSRPPLYNIPIHKYGAPTHHTFSGIYAIYHKGLVKCVLRITDEDSLSENEKLLTDIDDLTLQQNDIETDMLNLELQIEGWRLQKEATTQWI